ncbi:MAG: M17 family metallopeptidase [Gammaproteobacteria bacterium]
MSSLLPPRPKIRIQQITGQVSRASLDKLDHLVVISCAKPTSKDWRAIPDGKKLEVLRKRQPTGAGATVTSRLGNSAGTGITLGFAAKGSPASAFAALKLGGKLLGAALRDQPRSIGFLTVGLDDTDAETHLKGLALAALAQSFDMPHFSEKNDPPNKLRTIKLLGHPHKLDAKRLLADAEANNLTRWLTALPPNKLDAGGYRKLIETLAKENDWKTRFSGPQQLEKLGAGAFLAVAQGNATQDAGIMRISYRPKGTSKQPDLALVGKGIIFDTGGTNLKPHNYMLDMHQDMSGSAVALGTLLSLSRQQAPLAIDCWLAITENRTSANAYKPRDVVTACNGITIEVIHTDAEGRMALADTLALAAREKPGLIIDYATLTGACVSAVSERFSGVFSNRETFNDALIAVGRASGERVWPFPMDADFADDLKSDAADILQCAPAAPGDHIHAAKFLSRFVPQKTPWIHIDLSAATRKGGLGQITTEATGFGVRFSTELLLDHAKTFLRK